MKKMHEDAAMGNESKEELDIGEGPSFAKEHVYAKKILTYKQRIQPMQTTEVPPHTFSHLPKDDLFSDDENAPKVEDFLIIEG